MFNNSNSMFRTSFLKIALYFCIFLDFNIACKYNCRASIFLFGINISSLPYKVKRETKKYY